MRKNGLKIVGIVGCIIYLLNPGMGFIEILPDNLPFVGNLDEGAVGSALILLIQSLRETNREKKSDASE